MACSLGRDQMNLTLLSLRCAIANRFMNFRHIGKRGVMCLLHSKNADFIGMCTLPGQKYFDLYDWKSFIHMAFYLTQRTRRAQRRVASPALVGGTPSVHTPDGTYKRQRRMLCVLCALCVRQYHFRERKIRSYRSNFFTRDDSREIFSQQSCSAPRRRRTRGGGALLR